MSKDPAILFYTSDFLTGCLDLDFEERGQYITLLCLQHQKGRLSEKTIRLSIGNVSDFVIEKFIKDENGLYYNERMEEEINKRLDFTESRRKNGAKGGRPKKPSAKPSAKPNEEPKKNLPENENENEIIIDYLNEKANKSYKYTTRKTKDLINARINEGFNIDDFKHVINIKCKQWINDDKWNQYLRPETLFGTKFESYLNEYPKNKKYNDEQTEQIYRVRYKGDLITRYHTEKEIQHELDFMQAIVLDKVPVKNKPE